MINDRALDLLDENTESILKLTYLLKICKIPFESDCSRTIRLFYPNKRNKICEIQRDNTTSKDALLIFWEQNGCLEFRSGLTLFETLCKIKEFNKNRKIKHKFFLKKR